MPEIPLLTVGVVADSHIPDYAAQLHPHLIESLTAAGVQHILHAGDICIPAVLKALHSVAEVSAVRGNRDWAFHGELPGLRSITLAGVRIALLHGHGGWVNYLRDKFFYYREGYRLARYRKLLHAAVPQAQVVVFGHTHHRENRRESGRLLFNPGSVTARVSGFTAPSFGLLYIYDGGAVEGRIVELDGCVLVNRRWMDSKP